MSSIPLLYENFVANLEAEMARQGISQSELARRSGISRRTINRILRRLDKNPSLEVCEKLAMAVGISPAAVFVA